MLCAKYASGFFNVFLPALIWRIETLTAAGLASIPSMDSGIFEFIHLFNLYYGKYYIPLIFVIINTIIVWQNRKRFCQHFVRRYPRFLLLYIASFLLELGFLLNPFISYPADRFLNLSFVVFAQIPLLGYSIYIVLLRKGYPTGLGAAILVLGFLWTLGFFSCFSSPHAGGISEAVPQNEVKGIEWLVESKAAHQYVFSPGEKGNYAFSGNSSGNKGQLEYHSENSDGSEGLKEPFYLIVTTFSEAMGLEKSVESKEYYSVDYNSETRENSLYKIYDSLNIKIYKSTP
ncbi:hypothetical protein SDC9_141841 [bioreactor metagenome]|uniref:Uncharacterized protein n=1 Tax=bioreactor metagenome TaxID=1076179 RepID=A0A645E1I4_9ZZZZ